MFTANRKTAEKMKDRTYDKQDTKLIKFIFPTIYQKETFQFLYDFFMESSNSVQTTLLLCCSDKDAASQQQQQQSEHDKFEEVQNNLLHQFFCFAIRA